MLYELSLILLEMQIFSELLPWALICLFTLFYFEPICEVLLIRACLTFLSFFRPNGPNVRDNRSLSIV